MTIRKRAAARGVLSGLVIALFVSCGESSSPASPSGTDTPTGTGSAQSVVVVFAPVSATYNATMQGQSYTAAGGFPLELRPGTYEINGSFRGAALGIGFTNARFGAGGVQSGSVRALSGPEPTVEACRVLYFYSPAAQNGAAAVQQTFRLQFTVTASVGSACQL